MRDQPLTLPFDQPELPADLAWHCEPSDWSLDGAKGVLRLAPDRKTDFWQRTHYGFAADNGHVLYLRTESDFILQTTVTNHPVQQYDQAGLIVRCSDGCWCKTSCEYEPDEPNNLGAVVTNDHYSDWSTQPLDHEITTVHYRMTVNGPTVLVHASTDGEHWAQIRMAHLAEREERAEVWCGLYACCPTDSGFVAEFHEMTYQPLGA